MCLGIKKKLFSLQHMVCIFQKWVLSDLPHEYERSIKEQFIETQTVSIRDTIKAMYGTLRVFINFKGRLGCIIFAST